MRRFIRRFMRWYGANPLHLLALLASFAITGYAAVRLLFSRPVATMIWFLGAVIFHDFVLFPLYTLAGQSARAVLRHRAVPLPVVPWVNYLRVPMLLSGLLLLVWFPLIFRLPSDYQLITALSTDPYLERWLLVTAVLFALAAIALAVRLRQERCDRPGNGQPDRPVQPHIDG
jgi:hypothetical protein